VKLRDVVIGHSDLEQIEPGIGRAWGRFRSGFGYDLVQPVFRLFTEAVPMRGGEPLDQEKLARYYAARDKLGLSLVDAEGNEIRTSAIHIADYTTESDKKDLELDVLISDEDYWTRRNG
jgi:hypothetical protein